MNTSADRAYVKVREAVGPSGPAFPLTFQSGITEGIPDIVIETGMSLRDYFAAMALNGMMANSFQPIKYHKAPYDNNQQYPYAEAAYNIADEMLESRKHWMVSKKTS